MNNIKSTFIRKRGNNYNVIIEYYDSDGKTKQKSIAKYNTKKEADKHLIDLKSSINNNKFIISKDITVVDRCYKYIEDNKKDWSYNTLDTRMYTLKLNIEPFFKDTKLSELTIYKVQMFINNLYDNFKANTAKNKYSFLKIVLQECYRMKEINENICDFIKIPKKKTKSVAGVYTKEELIQIFSKLENEIFEIHILLTSLLGLRKSEAYGLTWDNIDFENNTIKIDKISIYVNKKIMFKDPKTENSKRVLAAPIELMNKLKKEKIKQNQLKLQNMLNNDLNLVCLNKRQEPYKKTDLNRYFSKFCKENNFKELRIHDLRHTAGTLLLQAGVDLKIISSRLGHSNINVTSDIYLHSTKEIDKTACDKMSELLFNSN